MNNGRNLPKANKFIKKRKKIKLWRRLLLMAGSIVVFITTYMLILPAITAEVGTLNIFDEVSSSSSVVVEDNELMEDNIISDNLDNGLEIDSDNELDDGTIIDITFDNIDIKEEKEENADEKNFFEKLVAAALSSDDGVTISTSGDGDNGKYVCKYDPETGNFELGLNVNFTIPQNVLKDYNGEVQIPSGCNKSYIITFPSDIIVPDKLLNNNLYNGYQSGTSNLAFYYYFEPVYDADGNITNYQVVMTFLDDFLNTLTVGDVKNPIEGTVSLEANISSESYKEDGTIKIKDTELGFDLEIKKEEIKFDDGETINRDVMVTKDGKYNSADNTITYTVMVVSNKGTGDSIEIMDSFNNSSFLSDLNAELVNVTYEKGVVGVNKSIQYASINQNKTTFEGTTVITDTDNNGAYYQKDENGNLTIILPGLDAAEGDYPKEDWETTTYKNANAYLVKYTYKVDPEKGKTYTAGNTAKVEIFDEIAGTKIEDSDTKTVTVTSKTIISKSGSLDKNTGIITWTITVGDEEESLNGYTLFDEMFSDLTEDELKTALKSLDGSDISDDKYEIIKNDEGKIAGIKFNENSGKKYEIKYTSTVSGAWISQSITNKAELIPDDDTNPSFDATSSVYYPGGSDCFTKNLDSAESDDNNNYTLNWNTSFNIPVTGIPAGTTFTDYVEGNGHFISASQAKDIINTLKSVWGEDNIKDIQLYADSDRWNMKDDLWVNADNISVADETKYYQFRFTTVKEIVSKSKDSEVSDKVSYTNDTLSYKYSTTANITNVADSSRYWNSLSTVGTTKTAEWIYNKKVVKYGCGENGSLSSENVDISTNDGTVVWVVRVGLDKQINSYKITDTLPSGVSLSELSIAKNYNNNYESVNIGTIFDTTSLFNNALNIKYDSANDDVTGQQSIVLNATVNSDSESLNDLNSIYIKYVCKLEKEEESDKDKIYELANSVKVTLEGEEVYGTDDQITNVTWEEKKPSGDTVTKDDNFDKNNNIVSYSLDINPDGTMYTINGEDFSDIQLKDILTYSSYPNYGIIRDASLVLNSVKLYYAKTDSDGKGIRGLDGKLVKGDEVKPEDYVWSYNEDTKYQSWANDVTKNIYLTIPNGVPFVFEYQYLVKIITDESNTNPNDKKANVTNKATVTVNGQEIETTPDNITTDTIEDSGTSGSANAGAGYTLYKVDKDNFALTLPGAVFDLYYYNQETNDFTYVDSYQTSSGGSTGIKGVPVSDENNEIYAYRIQLSNGEDFNIPVNAICYFVESAPPEGYKLDTKKYYFYFGKTLATSVESCVGYNSDTISSARNVIISRTEYISNEHSIDYYAEKTNLSVVKKWVDADGNDITKSKSDGSIGFNLYRVFTDVNGNEGNQTGGTDVGSKVKLNWSLVDQNSVEYESGSVNCNAKSKVMIDINNSSLASWGCEVKIYDADTGETLVMNNPDWVTTPEEPDTGEKWDTTTGSLKAEIDVGEKDRNIVIKLGNWTADDTKVTISNSGSVGEETTENQTEVTTSESTGAVLHQHNFSDMKNNIIGEDKSSTITDDYFEIIGNLADDHGNATYKIDGQATELTRCLKIESTTSIKFTVKNKGVLTLVFNTNGNGNETQAIVNGCKINGATYSATNNVLSRELVPGEYTLTRQGTCYLFYMSFEEGATIDNRNIYSHNFNDGKESEFYDIASAGSTASNKGTVAYNDMTISTCYKMNSKAVISFDAPYDGIINMVLTNPNNAAVVGAKIDGVDHYAAPMGEFDDKGNEIYLLTARVSQGKHSIKRINSTEVMLYYIDYIPDNYGDDIFYDEVPNNPNATLIGEYTISAQDNWAKAFRNLPWQVLSDNGELLGYYSYYVVEINNEGYITQYKNNVSGGISSGTIGIQNQDKDNNTKISVTKSWLDSDGKPNNEHHSADNVEFNLYGAINLYPGETLETTRTESHTFTSYDSNFYKISTNYTDGVINGPYIQDSYGIAKYNDKIYNSCMKIEGQTSIKFTAPASGKLTLVFSNKLPEASYGGWNFNINHGGSTSNYAYNAGNKETIGNCIVNYSSDAVVFNIDLEEEGDYEIASNKKQCYLFYMDYKYKLSNSKDGILIGSYTINESDTDGENNWTKNISGLPLYIKDNNNRIIGEYSYYIVETVPGNGYITTVDPIQDGEIISDLEINNGTITAGTVKITNQKKIEDVDLPKTGGNGRINYMLAGLLLSMLAGLLLYIKHIRFRV